VEQHEKQTNQALGQLGGAVRSVDGKVDQIAARQQQPACPQQVAMPSGPDPQTQQALQSLSAENNQNRAKIDALGGQFEQLRSEVPKAINAAVQPITDKVGAIDAAVKPIEAIKARLDGDIQAGGIKGKIAQRIEDDMGDPTAWIKHALIGFGVLLVVVFGGLLIHAIHAHKAAVKAGQPDPTDLKLQALAAKLAANPATAPLAAVVGGADAAWHRLEQKMDSHQAANQSAINNLALHTPSPSQTAAPAAAPSANVTLAPSTGATSTGV